MAGFRSNSPTNGYERLALSEILTRGDFRADLFCDNVCGRFSLSEDMKERSARDDVPSKNIELFICSPEDIFLFKTMTDREGDHDDCVTIVKNKADFDWDIVLKEAQEQSGKGKAVWITWIANRLEEFAERGMNVPILDRMNKMADEYLVKWESSSSLEDPDKHSGI